MSPVRAPPFQTGSMVNSRFGASFVPRFPSESREKFLKRERDDQRGVTLRSFLL
jgi:hypothetical protein